MEEEQTKTKPPSPSPHAYAYAHAPTTTTPKKTEPKPEPESEPEPNMKPKPQTPTPTPTNPNPNPKQKKKYNIRRATKKDIPRLAEIGSRAFANEPIDAQWFPLRELYPRDYHRGFVDEFSERLVTAGNVILVLEVDYLDEVHGGVGGTGDGVDGGMGGDVGVKRGSEKEKDEDGVGNVGEKGDGKRRWMGRYRMVNEKREKKRKENKRLVVAYAVFVKHGPRKEDLENWSPDSLGKKINRTILHLKQSINSKFRPNRAMSPSTIRAYFAQAAETYKQHMDDPTNQAWIDCRGLAVDPAHQRRGYGEKLIEWLGHAAWAEDVPVFGDSTATGLPLYLKNGCERIGKIELAEKVVDAGRGRGMVRVKAVDAVLLMWRA